MGAAAEITDRRYRAELLDFLDERGPDLTWQHARELFWDAFFCQGVPDETPASVRLNLS